MVTLGELFDELDYELEDMLDILSQAIDLIEDGKVKEGVEVLKALEEDMFDFLDYVDVDEDEVEIIVDQEVEEEKPKPLPKAKKSPPKAKGKK